MARNSDLDTSGAPGADAARQGPHDQSAATLAPTPQCVMSADSEAQCLTRFLKRSALAAGILIGALVVLAIVVSAVR
jgi:hypothetical protein